MAEATGDTALRAACAAFGIAPEYLDIWGGLHGAPDDALRELLGAFGVDVTSPAALAAATASGDARGHDGKLPPVQALRAGAAHWPLALHVADATALRWRIEEEGGAVHAGLCEPGAAEAPAVEIACALPSGYHRLRIEGIAGATLLIAAPATCYRPPALRGEGRTWGPSLQLYALRSERNWGMGDFGDLAWVIEQWAERGAGIVGLNPLHALFAHNPAHASPYSPSSRLHLNALYIDVEAVADLRACEPARKLLRSAGFQERLAQLRASELVDHAGVAAAKFELLRLLHASFRERELAQDTPRARDFRAFQHERGESLRRHALFEALQARFHADDASVWGWPCWPEAWRDPRSAAVQTFAAEHAAEVEYHEYLQWLADGQLAALSRRCRERGLAVGLYLDLAVSVDRAGSDAWGHGDTYALAASVGAPPDEFNTEGQGWGLPPLRPDRLRASGHALFIETLRAAMRHAGALRIDHVMALMRLFCIPAGRSPRDGAYVHYPFEELLAIVALESERSRCLVIGEDLGTVAPELRAALSERELLSYRLLLFERGDGGRFKPPADYPAAALVAFGTHDLPTLAGWWRGEDLALRRSLGLLGDDAIGAELSPRSHDRVQLLQALKQAGLLPAGSTPETAAAQPLTPALVNALHAFLAATPSRVLMLQLEDAIGVAEQANLPGTTDEHPNWRRKLPLEVEQIDADPRVAALAELLSRARPHTRPEPRDAPRAQAIIPRATYRLQLHQGFDFDAAAAVLPYLARLGVSHVYCSPILRARAGSSHGYDIVAHDEINPELGGAAGFERFCAALRAQGLGLLLDMVPNHMGVHGADNAWWQDVLAHGPTSAYARWFDIDWQAADRALQGKLLLPLLGDHYGAVLERGELRLAFDVEAGDLSLRYFEHRCPLDPRSYAPLLQAAAAVADEGEPLVALAEAFAALPTRDATDAALLAERRREAPRLQARLAVLAAEQPAARRAIEQAVAALNEPQSIDALDHLLEQQAWRLAYWRVAADEINYRRFFDINELAALRIEEPAVFEATQGFALDLAAAGIALGLRIDHPDGLYNPAQYFRRLQTGYARRTGLPPPVPGADGSAPKPLYVVVEKIAASHEDVPLAWPVHGTTGYRYAMLAGGVQVDTAARARFDRIWRAHSGEQRDFAAIAREGKRDILRGALAAELGVLAAELGRIARADRRSRDHSVNALREALAEVAAAMPVYRTYLSDDGDASEQDRRYIAWAVAQARRHSRAADASVFDFVHACLLGTTDREPLEAPVRRFALRFQQLCSPVAAKGVEDTAFYRYSRLVSLNEVGGDPATFGITVRAFHGASADRAVRRPHTILATSTHDNKRSEDLRCRLNVLSEMPAAWRLAARRWRALIAGFKTEIDGAPAPSAADDYLLLQTLLGTLPAGGLEETGLEPYRERIDAYAIKAAREAKLHTSWVHPQADYEAALSALVRGVLGRLRPNPLLGELQAFAQKLAWFGALNSVALAALKFTSPGVPDLYQGNELIDLSLVDPDNRRPVDYALRERWLAALPPGAPAPEDLTEWLRSAPDGRLKLWVSWRLLQLRKRLPALFRDGGYAPLVVEGERTDHALAYAREHAGITVVVMVGRLFAKLGSSPQQPPLGEPAWAGSTLRLPALAEGTRLDDALSGRTLTVAGGALRLAEALARLPVAVLVTGAG